MPICLEIIAASADDAKAAALGGADRLELCSALALGGLTPSIGTVRAVKEAVGIPVMCMVRPREGGMAYNRGEFVAMLKDAEAMLEAGADGLVFGFLTVQGEIDLSRCREFMGIVSACGGDRSIETVFHRAFDVVADPVRALEQLVDLGVTRILTSGRAPVARQGLAEIRGYVEQSRGRIQILPGGGISAADVTDVVAGTGVDQVHLYVTESRQDTSTCANPAIYFGAHVPSGELDYREVSTPGVDGIRKLLSSL